MFYSQVNEHFQYKTQIAALFGCHREAAALYHCVHKGNCLKKEPTYSDFQEAVAVLNLKMSIKLHELCEGFCIVQSTLVLCLNSGLQRMISVSYKWRQ